MIHAICTVKVSGSIVENRIDFSIYSNTQEILILNKYLNYISGDITGVVDMFAQSSVAY